MPSELVHEEEYYGRKLLVYKMSWDEETKKAFQDLNNRIDKDGLSISKFPMEWLTAYVSVEKEVDYEDIKLGSPLQRPEFPELTFAGKLDGHEGYWLGIDQNHASNHAAGNSMDKEKAIRDIKMVARGLPSSLLK